MARRKLIVLESNDINDLQRKIDRTETYEKNENGFFLHFANCSCAMARDITDHPKPIFMVAMIFESPVRD